MPSCRSRPGDGIELGAGIGCSQCQCKCRKAYSIAASVDEKRESASITSAATPLACPGAVGHASCLLKLRGARLMARTQLHIPRNCQRSVLGYRGALRVFSLQKGGRTMAQLTTRQRGGSLAERRIR